MEATSEISDSISVAEARSDRSGVTSAGGEAIVTLLICRSLPEVTDHKVVTMPTLTPHLDTIEQVYQKVLRESYRTWHARDFIHKADHFYNFCITAHSLRDYFVKHKGWGGDRKNKQHTAWNSFEVLRAVRDIANSAKHFSLRSPAQTKATEETKSAAMDIYLADGELKRIPVTVPDFVVVMPSGEEYRLRIFMSEVSEYWLQFLTDAGIPLGDDPHYFPDGAR